MPTSRSESPTSASSPSGLEHTAALSTLRLWLVAARPRTLPAAIAPVLVGTALAGQEDEFSALRFAAALVGSIFIQIGTNLSNDYSDARRGADTEDRLGPVRVTAGGLIPPRRVLIGTYIAFGVAVLAGVYLAAVAGWELIAVGAASILAGVLYTGGPRPYGYEGLGELFVFLFFGVVAVTGSYFVQTEELTWEAFALSVPVGLLSAAILVVNNVRDIDTDRRAGKRTLAVKLGRERARRLWLAMVVVAMAAPLVIAAAGGLSWWLALTALSWGLVPPLWQKVSKRTDGPGLNEALAETGRLLGVYSVLLAGGVLLS
jgi:1,4-dihydroxy-2-naphthoate polyprenyltransferase